MTRRSFIPRADYNAGLRLDPIDPDEALPTSQEELTLQKRYCAHGVTILVRHSGHSWLVAMIRSEQSTASAHALPRYPVELTGTHGQMAVKSAAAAENR